jgi:uncharacterized Fe-S cluster protein YjdI
MPRDTVKYLNEDITVVWKPSLCIHSTHCWKELGSVFNPKKRPWIDLSQADTERIVEQVKACPSGALSFFYHKEEKSEKTEPALVSNQLIIECTPNGPLLVQGDVVVKKSDGSEEIRTGTIALCRCGSSSNKPYCDGSHKKVGFQG